MQHTLQIPLTKIDVERRLIVGRAAHEIADLSKEIMDYATARPVFEKWSKSFSDATGGLSKGNVRVMHTKNAVGKLVDMTFDDDQKSVEIVAKIVDDSEWKKCLDGVYTGFSIGGGYANRWKDGDLTRYTPDVREISLVDNPCIPTARFAELLKADGMVETIPLVGRLHGFADAWAARPSGFAVDWASRPGTFSDVWDARPATFGELRKGLSIPGGLGRAALIGAAGIGAGAALAHANSTVARTKAIQSGRSANEYAVLPPGKIAGGASPFRQAQHDAGTASAVKSGHQYGTRGYRDAYVAGTDAHNDAAWNKSLGKSYDESKHKRGEGGRWSSATGAATAIAAGGAAGAAIGAGLSSRRASKDAAAAKGSVSAQIKSTVRQIKAARKPLNQNAGMEHAWNQAARMRARATRKALGNFHTQKEADLIGDKAHRDSLAASYKKPGARTLTVDARDYTGQMGQKLRAAAPAIRSEARKTIVSAATKALGRGAKRGAIIGAIGAGGAALLSHFSHDPPIRRGSSLGKSFDESKHPRDGGKFSTKGTVDEDRKDMLQGAAGGGVGGYVAGSAGAKMAIRHLQRNETIRQKALRIMDERSQPGWGRGISLKSHGPAMGVALLGAGLGALSAKRLAHEDDGKRPQKNLVMAGSVGDVARLGGQTATMSAIGGIGGALAGYPLTHLMDRFGGGKRVPWIGLGQTAGALVGAGLGIKTLTGEYGNRIRASKDRAASEK